MAPAPPAERERQGVRLALAALAVVVLVVYAPVRRFAFINFDDPIYVADNSHVRAGLTWEGVRWAFTTGHASNWHPLTWLSHMLDQDLLGDGPAGPHAVNVALHAAAALALYGALAALSGARWRSLVVAALFALHPTRVESVAWIAERKDVLSGLLWWLTLWGYARYAARPGWTWYLVTLALFALGLLAKPMLVTLPVVLLLLDRWPLGRRAAVREKVPFFVLSAVVGVVTVAVQAAGGAVVSADALPVASRLAKAAVAYVTYVGALLWPRGLALFYPLAPDPAWVVVAAVGLLAALSWGAAVLRRRYPYVLIGWLWYLVTLAPVIGVVQVGQQASADRYTYLPAVGLFIVTTWGATDLLVARGTGRLALAGLATATILLAAAASARQLRYWRDSEAIFTRTLAVTTDNYVAHNKLGEALVQQGRLDDARAHYAAALRIRPRYAAALINVATLELRAGEVDAAIEHYRAALAVRPDAAAAHNGLGAALARRGDVEQAAVEYGKAVALDPDYPEALANLGGALLRLGRVDEALPVEERAARLRPQWAEVWDALCATLIRLGRVEAGVTACRRAAQLRPESAEANLQLGNALILAGHFDQAAASLSRAVALAPDGPEGHHHLGIALAGQGRDDEALAEFRTALRLDPRRASAEEGVAITLYRQGRREEAIATLRRAVTAARAADDATLAAALQERLRSWLAEER